MNKELTVQIAQKCKDFSDASWETMLFLCGRAAGKKHLGAEAVVRYAEEHPNCKIGLFSPTFEMGVDNMVYGTSGILHWAEDSVLSIAHSPEYLLITWPNGSTVQLFNDTDAKKVRGHNLNMVWIDELDFFRFPEDKENCLYTMGRLSLGAGSSPKLLITATPDENKAKALSTLALAASLPGSNVVLRVLPSYSNTSLCDKFLNELLNPRTPTDCSKFQQEVLGLLPNN